MGFTKENLTPFLLLLTTSCGVDTGAANGNSLEVLDLGLDSPTAGQHEAASNGQWLRAHLDTGVAASIPGEQLDKNVALAESTRNAAASRWGGYSDDIFRNYVLSPVVATETVVPDWRSQFHAKLWAGASELKSVDEVARYVNREAFKWLGVSYKKEYEGHVPDQNPFESQKLQHASCTGLSIILVDALRSVGVPARLAFTPAWVVSASNKDSKAGLSAEDENHSWVEAFANGDWHVLGAAEDTELGLGNVWFQDQAKKAIPGGKNAIYAVSLSGKTELPIPWKEGEVSKSKIRGFDVTERYAVKSGA